MESLILPLDSFLATIERVGGKGSSLARMAAAGLPVPPGFRSKAVSCLAHSSVKRCSQLTKFWPAAREDISTDSAMPFTIWIFSKASPQMTRRRSSER